MSLDSETLRFERWVNGHKRYYYYYYVTLPTAMRKLSKEPYIQPYGAVSLLTFDANGLVLKELREDVVYGL